MTLSDEAEAFAGEWNVSRETTQRLDTFAALLRKWNPKINLVSASSLEGLWRRHIADSAQLFDLVPSGPASWADLGSGGGLPGMVIGIMAAETAPSLRVTLVESDGRKAAFLSEAGRACGVPVDVVPERIETAKPLRAEIVSARALAPLSALLEYARRHVVPGGICLFPKGEAVHTEIERARTLWRFEPVLHASRTNSGSYIVEIGDFERV